LNQNLATNSGKTQIFLLTRRIKMYYIGSVKIERNHPTPLYQQIANDIHSKIQSGLYPPGACIPSEVELMNQYKVGRITVRQAINILQKEGRLITKQGKGTFVSLKRIEQELLDLKSITEVLLLKGVEPTIKVIDYKVFSCSSKVRSELNLEEKEKVVRFRRLYLIRHSPLSLVYIYLPIRFMEIAEPLKRNKPSTETTYTIFERHGISLREARHVIRANPAQSEVANYLKINPGTPILTVERTTYSNENVPLEYIVFHYRADKFEFSVRLARTSRKAPGLVEEIVKNFKRNHLNLT